MGFEIFSGISIFQNTTIVTSIRYRGTYKKTMLSRFFKNSKDFQENAKHCFTHSRRNHLSCVCSDYNYLSHLNIIKVTFRSSFTSHYWNTYKIWKSYDGFRENFKRSLWCDLFVHWAHNSLTRSLAYWWFSKFIKFRFWDF